jgi:membrane protease YdiL (CAAX protease family)
MLALFLIASLIKVLDTFVLPVNELVGELIVTKSLGFTLVVIYVWACGRRLVDIGFHTQALGRSLFIAGVCTVGLFAVAYIVQLIALRASGEEVAISLTAVDPKTGLSGGLLFGLWMIVANLVNSAMEEGLFRGLMVRHFRLPFSVLGAILLQAFLFAIWHLNWPAEHLISGESSVGESAFEALALLLSTGIAGIVTGYMYYKTDNLWAPFLAHTINNSVLNFVFFQTAEGLEAPTDFGLFLAVWLPGNLVLIPIIGWMAKRFDMPTVKPWGVVQS